ncbi:hypothetical protein LLH00_00430 [bacterium]|nr:hypothetical protein [bacterium]
MDPIGLMPSPETIPAPWWVLEALGVGLLLLHLIVINVAVGGTLITLVSRLGGPDQGRTGWLPGALKSKLPTAFALGINLGIAPLLFFQVIYGHIFYTASTLMAVWWILVIPLLILAYYGAHFHSRKFANRAVSLAWLSLSAVVVLYIAFMFQNNISHQLHPGDWSRYFDNRGGTLLSLAAPVLWPRYLHFLTGAVAVAGLFGAVVWHIRGKRGSGEAEAGVATGLKIFGIATMVQMVIGFWLLLALPREIMLSFMGGSMLHTLVLFAGIVAALGLIMAAMLKKLWLTVGVFAVVMLAMVLMRTFLRYLYLKPYFQVESLTVTPMYGVFGLFLAVLVVGLVIVGVMLRWAVAASARKGAL